MIEHGRVQASRSTSAGSRRLHCGTIAIPAATTAKAGLPARLRRAPFWASSRLSSQLSLILQLSYTDHVSEEQPVRDLPGRPCSVAAALSLVGEKWSLLAIREISFGNKRFDVIARNTGP